MSNKFDWKALAEIATQLSKGYSLCAKCGTMWLANESLPCPKCLIPTRRYWCCSADFGEHEITCPNVGKASRVEP